ncbi:PKD domain-containing protein [bacterium]|nr:PKD domain-containing protein [bacterium]
MNGNTVLRTGAGLIIGMLLLGLCACGSSGMPVEQAEQTQLSPFQQIQQAAPGVEDTSPLVLGSVEQPVHFNPGNSGVQRDTLALLRGELYRQLSSRQFSEIAEAAPGPGNEVFSLATNVEEPDGGQVLIELNWLEVLRGDYDGNGRVDADDLLPLAESYGAVVDYLPAAEAEGLAWHPSGDISAEGERNWKLARIDGNRDGMLGIADVTVIAQHWGQRIDGYRVYRSLDGAEAQYLPWPGAEQALLSISRLDAESLAANNRRYAFMDFPLQAGEYTYTVKPYGIAAEAEGPASRSAAAAVSGIGFAGELHAELQASVASGVSPLTVQFDASASSVANAVITEYSWDFDGDGVVDLIGGSPSVEHVYPAAGGFPCILEIVDNFGRKDHSIKQISVDDAPQAAISLSHELVLEGETVTITLSSAQGSHPISGRVLDLIGPVSLSYQVETDNKVLQYPFKVPGEYRLSYLVTDANHITTRAQADLTVVSKLDPLEPHAVISLNSNVVMPGDAFVADGSESNVASGALAEYYWSSDGAEFISATDQSLVELRYATPGIKYLDLSVTTDLGRTDSVRQKIYSATAPLADLQGPGAIEYGKSARFSALSSLFFEGSSKQFDWDLDGDGHFERRNAPGWQTLTAENGPGSRVISVRITDEAGQTDVASRTVLFSPPPVANFKILDAKGPRDRKVILDGSDSEGLGIDMFRWSFQHGESIETTEPVLELEGLPREGSYWIGLSILVGDQWTDVHYEIAYAGWCTLKTDIPLKFDKNGLHDPLTTSLGINYGDEAFLMTVAGFSSADETNDYVLTRLSPDGNQLLIEDQHIFSRDAPAPVVRPLAMAVLNDQLHLVYIGRTVPDFVFYTHSDDLSLQSWSTPLALSGALSSSYPNGDFVADGHSMRIFYADSNYSFVTRNLEPAVSSEWSAPVTLHPYIGQPEHLEAALCNGVPVVVFTTMFIDEELAQSERRSLYMHALDAAGSSWSAPFKIDALTTEYVMELTELQGRPSILLQNLVNGNRFMRAVIADDASGSNWQEQFRIDDFRELPLYEDMHYSVHDGKPMILGWNEYHTLLRAQDELGSTWDQQIIFKDNFTGLTHTSAILLELGGYPMVVTYGETDFFTDHTVELHFPDDAPWVQ